MADSMVPSEELAKMSLTRTPFGKAMRKHFSFDPEWRPLNHGSFGTYPNFVKATLRHYQDLCESAPDVFFRTTIGEHSRTSRAALAKLLNVPREAVVIVPNATTGVNTVLRNLSWGPKDHVIIFSTIYGACEKTVLSLAEQQPLQLTRIEINYPVSDSDILGAFEAAIDAIRAKGDNPKVAIFDTIVSQPGVRMPFEALTAACRRHGVLSCIDGAHGVGQIALDLSALDPDFFVSNAHKWLFVPRGTAVFYVPVRNQHFIRTTLPTSHGYMPLDPDSVKTPGGLKAGEGQSAFENNFEFIGTIDASPWLCIPAALEFRDKVCGGEAAIMKYNSELVIRGGLKVAEMLGTEILENDEKTLNKDISMVTLRLPLDPTKVQTSGESGAFGVLVWIIEQQMQRFKTYAPLFAHADGWWVRLSGQVYLDDDDFVFIGEVLKTLCDEVRAGKHLMQDASSKP